MKLPRNNQFNKDTSLTHPLTFINTLMQILSKFEYSSRTKQDKSLETHVYTRLKTVLKTLGTVSPKFGPPSWWITYMYWPKNYYMIQGIAVTKYRSLLLFAWFLFTLGFDFLGPYGQYQQYPTAAF